MRTLYFILLIISVNACTPGIEEEEVEPTSSLPIQIREPREVIGEYEGPRRLRSQAGPELLRAVTPYLMNLMAKYEIGALRLVNPITRNTLESRRAELREIFNDAVVMSREFDFALDTTVPDDLYATTQRLEEIPITSFASGFTTAVNAEFASIKLLLDTYNNTALPTEFESIRRRLLVAMEPI